MCFWKEQHLPKKSLAQVPKEALSSQEVTAPCFMAPEDLPVGKIWRWMIATLIILPCVGLG
jgi:hypothetical protein